MAKYGPESAYCWVYTFKKGLLSAAGHDLKLAVGDFEIELQGEQSITARFSAASVRVACALHHGQERQGVLSKRDVSEIESNVAKRVLDVDRFPDIRFSSRSVERHGDVVDIKGELSLRRARRGVAFTACLKAGRWCAEVPLHQPDYGIKPFTAMLGALRIRPLVRVRVEVPDRR